MDKVEAYKHYNHNNVQFQIIFQQPILSSVNNQNNKHSAIKTTNIQQSKQQTFNDQNNKHSTIKTTNIQQSKQQTFNNQNPNTHSNSHWNPPVFLLSSKSLCPWI